MCDGRPYAAMHDRALNEALAASPGMVPVEAADGVFTAALAAGATTQVSFFGPYPRVYHGVSVATDNAVARASIGVRMRRDNGRYVVGSPTQYVSAGGLTGGDVMLGSPTAISPTYAAARQNWLVEIVNRGKMESDISVEMWFTELVQPGEAT